MRVLLDSHALLWAADDPAKLPAPAMGVMQDLENDLLISAATIWEIAIKVALGKLPLSLPYRRWVDRAIFDQKLSILAISLDHAERQVGLPFHHRDPVDRMIAAQALVEGIPLVSADAIFDAYGVPRLWN
jgi:PIN domain nuclease of toxin-antitoxin system